MSDRFLSYVQQFEKWLSGPAPTAEPGSKPSPKPKPPAKSAPVCVLVSPHPDDEAISGALAWRLRHHAGWRVINIAVTLGSRPDRREERWAEAQQCCGELGFELIAASGTPGHGLEGISPQEAAKNSDRWQHAVNALRQIFQHLSPQVVICPHALDGHAAHIGTSLLTQQALVAWSPQQVHLLYSEYWNTQIEPRLAVGLDAEAVARLMQGLVQHRGEISRNPYHRSLPAWFADSARRGAERVNPPGSLALDFAFAALYGWRIWKSGEWQTPAPQIWRPYDPPPDCFTESR